MLWSYENMPALDGSGLLVAHTEGVIPLSGFLVMAIIWDDISFLNY